MYYKHKFFGVFSCNSSIIQNTEIKTIQRDVPVDHSLTEALSSKSLVHLTALSCPITVYQHYMCMYDFDYLQVNTVTRGFVQIRFFLAVKKGILFTLLTVQRCNSICKSGFLQMLF